MGVTQVGACFLMKPTSNYKRGARGGCGRGRDPQMAPRNVVGFAGAVGKKPPESKWPFCAVWPSRPLPAGTAVKLAGVRCPQHPVLAADPALVPSVRVGVSHCTPGVPGALRCRLSPHSGAPGKRAPAPRASPGKCQDGHHSRWHRSCTAGAGALLCGGSGAVGQLFPGCFPAAEGMCRQGVVPFPPAPRSQPRGEPSPLRCSSSLGSSAWKGGCSW